MVRAIWVFGGPPFWSLRSGSRPNLREFVTTVTELIAIAPAAAIGFRNPNSPRIGDRTDGTVPSEKIG